MRKIMCILPGFIFFSLFIVCLPIASSVCVAAAPAKELPDWGKSAEQDIFSDYGYLRLPGDSEYGEPNIVGSFSGHQSVQEIMKAGGTAPKGKLLICISSAHMPGDTSSQELFDYRAMNMLPENLYPKTVEEIEYVLHVRYTFTDVRSYVSGARGLKPNAIISLMHLPTKKTMSSTTLEGSAPPERPQIFKEGQKVHIGEGPSFAKITKAYARCLATATGRISDDFGYITRNGKASIILYSGTKTDLAIPASLDGYAVNAIEAFVFSEPDQKRLVAITLPPSIERIGKFAFSECEELKNVNFPEGLKEIGDSAFRNVGLESLVLPSSLERIGESAFTDCQKLKSVNFPEGLKEIRRGAFAYTGLESVALPSSLERIEPSAFARCDALKTVRAAEGLTSIGQYAFRGCYELKDIYIPASVTNIAADAFSGIKSPPFTIHSPKASYATRFTMSRSYSWIEQKK